jgi:hypothetical protein
MRRTRAWKVLRQVNLFKELPPEIIIPDDAIQEAIDALAELLLAYAQALVLPALKGGEHESQD